MDDTAPTRCSVFVERVNESMRAEDERYAKAVALHTWRVTRALVDALTYERGVVIERDDARRIKAVRIAESEPLSARISDALRDSVGYGELAKHANEAFKEAGWLSISRIASETGMSASFWRLFIPEELCLAP